MEFDRFMIGYLVAGGVAVSIMGTALATPSPFTIFDKIDICANVIVGNKRGAAETALNRLKKVIGEVFPFLEKVKDKELKVPASVTNLSWGETLHPVYFAERLGECYKFAAEDFDEEKKQILKGKLPSLDVFMQ